jgi:putative oxidoreductase
MTEKNSLKSASLLALRAGTGLLLVLWGGLRLVAPTAGPGLADKYYAGFLNGPALQIAYGGAEVIIGILVVLGLLRRFAYPLQALILVSGALLIWRYLVDPLGMWLLSRDDSQILFFPSIALAAASVVLIAFKDDDRWALDARFNRSGENR